MSGIINSAGSRSGVIGTTELDYEEGTWTGLSNGSLSSATNWSGHYVKIGRLVRFSLYHAGAVSAASSGAYITGLPFTPASSASGGAGSGAINDGSPETTINLAIFGGVAYVYLNASSISSDTGWVGSGDYKTDS